MEDRLKDIETVGIADVYVPVKRRKTLDSRRVDEMAESILEKGQLMPIWVRRDEERLVLVQGLHRLEALKALGEETIQAIFVQARRS